ncbi:Uma2 family endonuclease [Limnothrix sp. FACHB-881]|nr:Uma2 family endonuclease [Limnothrix sp. FACHB-881]MBD2635385.1 Uma2 family endonuclease [Limnothrix sp. FACHB-881]
MLISIDAADPYFYPDGVVTCDQRDRQATSLISHPKLIIEVLSPSTARFDRTEKLADYRTILSLTEKDNPLPKR